MIVLTEHPMDAVNGLELYEIDEQRQIDKRCAVSVCRARFGALSHLGEVRSRQFVPVFAVRHLTTER
jgi:hypothetical protein